MVEHAAEAEDEGLGLRLLLRGLRFGWGVGRVGGGEGPVVGVVVEGCAGDVGCGFGGG